MSNQYIIYNFRAEIQGHSIKPKWSEFNKKLSGRKEAARCSVSMKILQPITQRRMMACTWNLGLRSFKVMGMAPFD